MKLNKTDVRVLGIVGVFLGFLSGMFVEYTNNLILAGPDFGGTVFITVMITLGIAGTLIFSELS